MRVLIVEDEPNLGRQLRSTLEGAGYAVDLATDGEDGHYLGATDVTLSQKSNFARGLQPGDLTKYSALPWQADFNECTTQDINITYETWNRLDPSSEGDPWLAREMKTWLIGIPPPSFARICGPGGPRYA